MVISMLASGSLVKKMARGPSQTTQVLFIEVNGRMEFSMAKVNKQILVNSNILDNGRMVKNMVKG